MDLTNHAFSTSVTHPACAGCAPKASGSRSSGTLAKNICAILLLPLILLSGCASVEPIQVESFPLASDLKVRPRNFDLYKKGQEDFTLLSKGFVPKHARAVMQVYDGGSIFYKGKGYRIISWRRLSDKDGKHGLWIGPEIVFESPISTIGLISFSEAQFKPLQKQ